MIDPKGVGRRDFLRLAGCACAALGPLPPQARPRPQAAPAPPIAPFALEEATLAALQEKMQAGTARARWPSPRATSRASRRSTAAARRCARVIEINPDALAIADALDARAQGQGRARPAARHPGPGQGQHRHRRPDARPRPARWRSSGSIAARATPSSSSGCARRAR